MLPLLVHGNSRNCSTVIVAEDSGNGDDAILRRWRGNRRHTFR